MSRPQEALEVLIGMGLTFSDCLKAFAARRSEKEMAFVKAAKQLHHDEGTLEVDDAAQVSIDDPEVGAYVMAWVWVDSDEAKA